MNPYKLADDGLCTYCGVARPLDDSGTWYDQTNWEAGGYANAVRVTCMPNEPEGAHGHRHIIVERLVIYRPDSTRLAEALETQADPRIGTRGEIEACLSYGYSDQNFNGVDPAMFEFAVPDSRTVATAASDTEEAIWALLARLVGRDSCA